MSTSDTGALLLQHLVTRLDLCLVSGPPDAVCEACMDPASLACRVGGAGVTMANGPWPLPLDATKVHTITGVVTPDTAQNAAQLSDSVRLFGAQDTVLLRAFFLAMSDAHGVVRPERVQQYEALRARAGGQDTVLVA